MGLVRQLLACMMLQAETEAGGRRQLDAGQRQRPLRESGLVDRACSSTQEAVN